MKNKMYLLFSQCLFIIFSFFNKLFVSEAKAEGPTDFMNDIPLVGVIAPPSPIEVIARIAKSALIIIVPIGLLVVLIVFLRKKFGKKVNKKKKK